MDSVLHCWSKNSEKLAVSGDDTGSPGALCVILGSQVQERGMMSKATLHLGSGSVTKP